MHIFRWIVGIVLGLPAGYLSLSFLATFAYALPRAVSNAARGFVGWSVSRSYLLGAFAYAGLLLFVVLVAYLLRVDLRAFLFGALLPIISMLANVKRLRHDVDEGLSKALAGDLVSDELPSWTTRSKPRLVGAAYVRHSRSR